MNLHKALIANLSCIELIQYCYITELCFLDGGFIMRITKPKPFFFEAGKRAVLLLHGFTGNSSDVRMLGRFLEKNGYTSLAPHYKGHGVPPEELIKTGPTDWWQDVKRI